ncbi:JAB domain-containing protein [Luteimonas sp. RD2P54]|uniref:JAB domain-containing protein n=1 Tax=Luteimonas endophytica TaxID=3042023 RepID=A0ABT6JBM4_9GAMM|nr:JAB domain-containing protein [Luteimonas endophytica]MDH5824215.1 JAB domain-containing protein [Luteimonas endophytica]
MVCLSRPFTTPFGQSGAIGSRPGGYRLKQALDLVDIRVLDHIVISAEGFTSMASRGWV